MTGMKKNEWSKVSAQIQGKWIVFSDESGKTLRFRRGSKRGCFLESMMNNPKGVHEDVLAYCSENKKVLPLLPQEEHKDWVSKQKQEDIMKAANVSNNALVLLTNGKAKIETSTEGVRLVVPKEMEKGFSVLMDMFSDNLEKKKHSFDGDRINDFNSMFEFCGVGISAVRKKDGVGIGGKDQEKLLNFMREVIGYKIPEQTVA